MQFWRTDHPSSERKEEGAGKHPPTRHSVSVTLPFWAGAERAQEEHPSEPLPHVKKARRLGGKSLTAKPVLWVLTLYTHDSQNGIENQVLLSLLPSQMGKLRTRETKQCFTGSRTVSGTLETWAQAYPMLKPMFLTRVIILYCFASLSNSRGRTVEPAH